MNALIGYTGFVGGELSRQNTFDELYNTKNILDFTGRNPDLVVCAGLSAKKWIANRHPEEDWTNICSLINVLKTVKTKRFVLISTIDVYQDSLIGDETTIETIVEGHPYGLNRRRFEREMLDQFPTCLIVRLPGLFGRGLKKNVIFDLLNGNCVESINIHSKFQWYDTGDLWKDLQIAISADVQEINLFPEPIVTQEIVDLFFENKYENLGIAAAKPAEYNIKTVHHELYGGSGGYIHSASRVIEKISAFIQCERELV